MSIIFSSKNYYSNNLGWKYSNLKLGYVLVNSQKEPIKVDLIPLAANDRTNWQSATSSKENVDCRIYEITIKEDEDFDAAVENLKYFFIRADRAYKKTTLQYGLLVRIAGANLYRLRVWLSMLASEGSRYNLLYCNITNKNDIDPTCYPIEPPDYINKKHRLSVGRIMPLMRIVSFKNEHFAGDVDISTLYSTEPFSNKNPNGVKLSDEELRECFEKDYKTWEFHWWSNIRDLCKIFLIRLVKNIKGDSKKLDKEKKAKLKQELLDLISSKRQNMSLFSELCWFYNLQYLMEEKLLLNPDNTINITILQQSYLDVITYTDGVLQLLENSCQHSQLKTAYLYLRTHYVNRTGTDRQLFKTVSKRNELVHRYQALSGIRWELNQDAKSYVEISVTDDAYVSKTKRQGIWETYCDNAKMRYPNQKLKLPNNLKEIFGDNSLTMSTSDEGVVHHYGIPALRQLMIKNHGIFLVSSPMLDCTEIVKISATGEQSVTREQLWEKKRIGTPALDETSEYHILFPLGLVEQEKNNTTNTGWASLFDVDNIREHTTTKIFNLPDEIKELEHAGCFLEQDTKISCIERALFSFRKKQDSITDIENCIQLFDIRNVNSLQLELFTKFLFRVILLTNNQRRLYAVYFDDYLKQQEFIRLFGIFFHRTKARLATENICLEAQIALCSTHQQLDVPEVNLILNAQNWDSLLESARRFAYCNLESSQNIYAQIKYLSYSQQNISSEKPMFPFDLHLSETMKGTDSLKNTHTEETLCWFLQRIAALMQRDLQHKQFGIKIDNIHAYLQSNIHLQSFYEAEQLFHNAAYVSRFAYLMAQRLIRDSYISRNYLIICYEAYSSLLGQYLADYLKVALEGDALVEYAIMYQEEKGKQRLVMPPKLHDTDSAKAFYQNCKFVCLFPIGTTLSTIHMMHDCLVKESNMQINAENMRNLVLVLVTDANPQSLQTRYWYAIPKERLNNSLQCGGRVKLYGRYNESEWNVDYFLKAETVWHNPEDCARYENERTIVHSDASATELNMVFPIKEELEDKRQQFHQYDVCSLINSSEGDINDGRVKMLETCMYYGHIASGSNHYGFYIDLPRYYDIIRDPKQSEKYAYTAWLEKMQKIGIDKDAFNIIVSPLRNGRSPLLKDIVDTVFEHSIHILQLDLHNARRTDIRTKYSYIAEECKQLCQTDPRARINFYYIDDSIVSAETLHRGRSMVQMLLGECIPKQDKDFLYAGVFVLVNRSSKDTVRTFVKDPNSDFHAFVHLAIPHYNTRRNYCPACQRIERYQQMILRSTTNRFAEEYQRLSEKHKLRTLEEYTLWQKEHLYTSPGAFQRLRQWVYYHNRPQSNEIVVVKAALEEMKEGFCHKFIRSHADNTTNKMASYVLQLATLLKKPDIQQRFLEEMEQQTLCSSMSFMKSANTCKKRADVKAAFEKVWNEYILPEKAYRRTISAHKAYCVLPLEIEPVYSDGIPNKKRMFDLVVQYLTPDESYKTDIERWEYILSGLKVVSRDFLARHHLLRETAFDVLHCIADILQGKILEDERIMNLLAAGKKKKAIPSLDYSVNHPIDPLLRYQMFHSVLRRLSEMESNYSILSLSQGLLLNKLQNLTEIFFNQLGDKEAVIDRWFYCTIPSYERMIFDYGKCIKLATMSEDEENKSMLIQKEHRHFSNREANGFEE